LSRRPRNGWSAAGAVRASNVPFLPSRADGPRAALRLCQCHVLDLRQRVESRRGAVSHTRSVSPPRSSNRTCRFPASGFPTGFTSRLSASGQGGRGVNVTRRTPRAPPQC
jgi:hypothetical protein